MNRRNFLRRSLVTVIGGSAVWLSMRNTAWARLAFSIFGGEKKVGNAKPPQIFFTKSFAKTESIRFLAIGDWGTGDKFQRKVAASMRTFADDEKPQFIISTGDNFYPDGARSASDKQFTTKWHQVYTGASLDIPWYVALGNHDYHIDPDAEVAYSKINPRWKMPARYFSFTKSQTGVEAEFFIIDTEMLAHGKKEEISAQLTWLESSLMKSTSKWKIVVGHHMIRSHGVYGDQKFMLKMIKPLLDKYKVQLYLNGHDHDLQYLKSPQDYFACIISGGGGGARDTGYGKNTIFASTNGGFVYIAITRELLHAQFLASDGNVQYVADVVNF